MGWVANCSQGKRGDVLHLVDVCADICVHSEFLGICGSRERVDC